MRVLFALIAAVWLVLPTGLTAQTDPDFARFDRFASSVETSIENGRLPDAGFERLRDALAEWRDDFQGGETLNSVQIDALQAQIKSLGAKPADGSPEPAAISDRRAALETQLQEAMAPRVASDEAYARADALIRQIDSRLRARQTDALLELTQTPLDPTLWGGAVTALADVFSKVQTEATANLNAIPDRTTFWQRIVIAVLIIAAAVLLVTQGPRLVERMLARVETSTGEHGRVVFGFVASFCSVLAAMLGVSLLNFALISSGILGETGRAVAIGINAAILAYAISRWLSGRLFPERESIPTPFELETHQRAKARRSSTTLGLLTGLLLLLGFTDEVESFGKATRGVLAFPLFLLIGLAMFRLGRLIHIGGQTPEGADNNFSDRVERLLGRALQLAAIAGALAAVIGFQNLARGILLPTALSLGLIAFLISLHFALRSGYAMLRGLDADGARQALAPVLVSFLLVFAALPGFALIWGARSSDLAEAWTTFKAGVPLGNGSISPVDFLTFAVIFALGFGVTRLVQGTLKSSVLPRTKIDVGGRNAIVSGLGYLGITIAAIAGITAAGIDLSSFAIIIGALGVGIGFGLQNIVNNFVSGIILLIERPISEGDWVEVNGKMGIVEAISVRSTRIKTFDRTDVIVPNGDLISGTVTNWTRGDSIGRIVVPIGVAYGTDTKKVEGILQEIAEAHPIVAMDPAPAVVFSGFGADSMDFEIRAILSDINYGLTARSDINHEIARRFAEEKIEIPFAQRDLWLRNPESLASGPQQPRLPSGPLDPSLGGLEGDSE